MFKTRRRGLSFIEVVTSIVLIGIISTALLASVSIITRTLKLTTDYTALKIYATNKFETIQTDLEIGEEGGKDPIDAINYNDGMSFFCALTEITENFCAAQGKAAAMHTASAAILISRIIIFVLLIIPDRSLLCQ